MSNLTGRCLTLATLATGLCLTLPARGAGTTVVYNFDTIFSANSVAPNGGAPWVNATLANTAGGVLLTISNANLFGGEKLDEAYFNLSPNLDATHLTFAFQSQVGSFTAPQLFTGTDKYRADGEGYYDIKLAFNTSAHHSFTGGESITYLVSGIAGLSVNDFTCLSTPTANAEPFYAAIHVLGTGPNNNKSAWVEPGLGPSYSVTAPEPGTGALGGLAAGVWYAVRSMRRRARQ